MKELSSELNNNELIDHYINNNAQFRLLSHELYTNYQKVNLLIDTYNEELKKRLILARPIDMKHFFRDINTTLKYMAKVFTGVNNEKIKLFIINKINNQRQLNLNIARKYLTKNY